MLITERAARVEAELAARDARAEALARALEIEKLKFMIAKLRHERFGPSAERSALLEQLELKLADLEEDASEAEAAAQMAAQMAASAAARKLEVRGFERGKPARRALPSTCRASASSIRRPRPARAAAGRCASWARTWPRRWSMSIRRHVFASARIHADDTTVPVLAKGKTRTGRLWTYVRDDRPFGGPDPPAAAFFYSRDRTGEHPERHLAGFRGLMQADAYAGFNRLYEARRKAGPIVEAACWAHAWRKFFDLARLSKAPIAIEAVRRIDALFAIEREINGLFPNDRLRLRQERSRPLIVGLETWLRRERARLSSKNEVARAIDYSLKRWPALTRFLDDGRLCLSNNAAEKALRGIAVGRNNWTFAGSDTGGERAAAIYSLIETAKLNDIDPRAWLAFVLATLPDHPAKRIDDLLPWNWQPQAFGAAA
jgi:Transposase IS66 family/IS66 C-terminal element/Transposase C of IS166 homeodomain